MYPSDFFTEQNDTFNLPFLRLQLKKQEAELTLWHKVMVIQLFYYLNILSYYP